MPHQGLGVDHRHSNIRTQPESRAPCSASSPVKWPCPRNRPPSYVRPASPMTGCPGRSGIGGGGGSCPRHISEDFELDGVEGGPPCFESFQFVFPGFYMDLDQLVPAPQVRLESFLGSGHVNYLLVQYSPTGLIGSSGRRVFQEFIDENQGFRKIAIFLHGQVLVAVYHG